MKKLLAIAAIAFLSCNETSKEKPISSEVKTATNNTEDVSYPYTATYSSKFEIGSTKYSKIVLDLWKSYDNKTLDNTASAFADTVRIEFDDGSYLVTTRDSLLAKMKLHRESLGEMHSEIEAISPLRSADKNENWVAVWGVEHYTGRAKKDSSRIHEIWMFDKNDKITFMRQYMSAPSK